jgi:hypothetical protein
VPAGGFALAGRAADGGERRFQFVLARDLHRTVDEMLRSLSAAEYAEWKALYAVEENERAKAAEDARNKTKKGKR